MEVNTYKIGEVAKKLVTSIRSIRYYEDQGLLTSIRTQRGTRLYSENHIVRLSVILRLTKLGFSIESIRKIVEIRENSKTGAESSSLVEMKLNKISNIISSKIEEMEKLNVEIDNVRNTIKKCNDCSNPPSTSGCPDCPVIDQLKNINLLNLVWDL
ncbi:MAG: MerR family transcriptional regulator [Candidatus Marithrix sp.]